MKTPYHIVRELTDARGTSSVLIKDKNGNMLLDTVEQNTQWLEHFKETRNQPTPTETFDFGTFTCQVI